MYLRIFFQPDRDEELGERICLLWDGLSFIGSYFDLLHTGLYTDENEILQIKRKKNKTTILSYHVLSFTKI